MRKPILMVAVFGLLGLVPSGGVFSASAADVSEGNLNEMIANAKTAEDHGAIAAYYYREAAEAEQKSQFYKKIASNYQKFRTKPTDMVNHCDEISKSFEQIANEDKALAAAHRGMEKDPGK